MRAKFEIPPDVEEHRDERWRREATRQVETVIAAIENDRAALTGEAADLLYHLMVVLKIGGIRLQDVLGELERRTGQSGIAEKASRKS